MFSGYRRIECTLLFSHNYDVVTAKGDIELTALIMAIVT